VERIGVELQVVVVGLEEVRVLFIVLQQLFTRDDHYRVMKSVVSKSSCRICSYFDTYLTKSL
jgi:hypothetical protein